jgi:hypothetical protein
MDDDQEVPEKLNVAGDNQQVFTGAVRVKYQDVTMNVERWKKS